MGEMGSSRMPGRGRPRHARASVRVRPPTEAHPYPPRRGRGRRVLRRGPRGPWASPLTRRADAPTSPRNRGEVKRGLGVNGRWVSPSPSAQTGRPLPQPAVASGGASSRGEVTRACARPAHQRPPSRRPFALARASGRGRGEGARPATADGRAAVRRAGNCGRSEEASGDVPNRGGGWLRSLVARKLRWATAASAHPRSRARCIFVR